MPSTLKPYVNKSSLMNAEAYGEIACHTRGGNKTANEEAGRDAPPGINGEKNKLTDPPRARVATSRQITATLNRFPIWSFSRLPTSLLFRHKLVPPPVARSNTHALLIDSGGHRHRLNINMEALSEQPPRGICKKSANEVERRPERRH